VSLVARRGVSFAACVCLYVCLRWVCKRIIAAYATCEREEVGRSTTRSTFTSKATS